MKKIKSWLRITIDHWLGYPFRLYAMKLLLHRTIEMYEYRIYPIWYLRLWWHFLRHPIPYEDELVGKHRGGFYTIHFAGRCRQGHWHMSSAHIASVRVMLANVFRLRQHPCALWDFSYNRTSSLRK